MDDTASHDQLQDFVRDACPSRWIAYADELKEAADALWADPSRTAEWSGNSLIGMRAPVEKRSISRTYILLVSLALENVLKGLAVSQDPTLVNKGAIDRRLARHKTLAIAELCSGLELSADERTLCDVVDDAIPYWGRYSVPLHVDKLKTEQFADPDFKTTVDRLYSRVHLQLYQSIRDGWDSNIGYCLQELRLRQYDSNLDVGWPGRDV